MILNILYTSIHITTPSIPDSLGPTPSIIIIGSHVVIMHRRELLDLSLAAVRHSSSKGLLPSEAEVRSKVWMG